MKNIDFGFEDFGLENTPLFLKYYIYMIFHSDYKFKLEIRFRKSECHGFIIIEYYEERDLDGLRVDASFRKNNSKFEMFSPLEYFQYCSHGEFGSCEHENPEQRRQFLECLAIALKDIKKDAEARIMAAKKQGEEIYNKYLGDE